MLQAHALSDSFGRVKYFQFSTCRIHSFHPPSTCYQRTVYPTCLSQPKSPHFKFCTIVCVAENEPESNGESDSEEEKMGEDGANIGECGGDQASASADARKETSAESTKGESQGMDVDESTAGTSAEGEQTESSSKEPTATSQGNEGGCSSGDVDNEKGEGEDAEEDDVPTLQLAWEVLELARIIYDKEADKNGCRLAEIRLLLGEINMESGKGVCAVCALPGMEWFLV